MLLSYNGRRRKLSARRVKARFSFWHPCWLMDDCQILGSEPRWFTNRHRDRRNVLQRRPGYRSVPGWWLPIPF